MNKNLSPAILRMLIVAFTCFSMASCAKKIIFQTSTVVPAATGKVKIKKDDNKNYSIDIKLENLAPANRLSPPRNLYVVWVSTQENGVKNIGQIAPSSSFLSGKVKASLKSVSPFKPTRIFITAEDNKDNLYPGNQEVLTTRSF